MSDALIEAAPGLANIVVADTAIGDVRGDEGFYHYGPYPAVELGMTRSFEDVWFLFLYGRLPSAGESADFAAHRALHGLPVVYEEIPGANHFTMLNELASPAGRLTTLVRQLFTR